MEIEMEPSVGHGDATLLLRPAVGTNLISSVWDGGFLRIEDSDVLCEAALFSQTGQAVLSSGVLLFPLRWNRHCQYHLDQTGNRASSVSLR